jgi:hypothetical protein
MSSDSEDQSPLLRQRERIATMTFDRTAGDRRFAFRTEVCVLCGISRAEFEQAGQPRCTEQASGKPERFTIAGR